MRAEARTNQQEAAYDPNPHYPGQWQAISCKVESFRLGETRMRRVKQRRLAPTEQVLMLFLLLQLLPVLLLPEPVCRPHAFVFWPRTTPTPDRRRPAAGLDKGRGHCHRAASAAALSMETPDGRVPHATAFTPPTTRRRRWWPTGGGRDGGVGISSDRRRRWLPPLP